MALEDVRALTFDVFGTVTDWRASVIREGEKLAARKGFETDWPSFADEWRFDGYIAGMLRVRDGGAAIGCRSTSCIASSSANCLQSAGSTV